MLADCIQSEIAQRRILCVDDDLLEGLAGICFVSRFPQNSTGDGLPKKMR
jgi:hypothetical protein